MRRLNGKVPGYDVDSQFDILIQTIEIERETAKAHKREVSSARSRVTDRWNAHPFLLLSLEELDGNR